MNLIRRFLIADGNEGGGTADPPTQVNQPPLDQSTPVANIPESAFTIEEIKNLGFDSKEAMLAVIQKSKADTRSVEEKDKETQIEKAEFLKFAAENDLVNEDFKRYESLQAKADRDLVFEKYAAEEKKDNPDLTDQEIKENFELDYKLNHEDTKIKAKAEAKIAKEAKELRSPAESAWQHANSEYDYHKKAASAVPGFDKMIDEIIKSSVPDKLVFKTKDGDQSIDVDVDLTKEQKAEVEKKFKNPKVFADWFNSTDEEKKAFKSKIEKKVEGFLKINLFDSGMQKSFDTGKGIGTKNGSNVGAVNPFPLVTNTQNTSGVSDDKISNEKANEARKRAKS